MIYWKPKQQKRGYARTRKVGDAYSMDVVRYKKKEDIMKVRIVSGPPYLAAVASTAGSLLQLALPDWSHSSLTSLSFSAYINLYTNFTVESLTPATPPTSFADLG